MINNYGENNKIKSAFRRKKKYFSNRVLKDQVIKLIYI